MTEKPSSKFLMMEISSCPVCASTSRAFLWKAGEASVFRCASCGLAYLNPALDPEGMAAAYASTESLMKLHDFHAGYYEYTDLNKPTRTRDEFLKHLVALEKQIPDSAARSILDVGYGNGMFLALAQSRGWQVAGLDTSVQNADSAKKNYNLDLDIGFFQEHNFKKQFAAVTMLDVIEHQVHPALFVKKAYEVLSPGGHFLVALPHEDSFLRFLSQAVYQLSFGAIDQGLKMVYVLEHVAYYNRQTLSRLLTSAGFEIADCYYSSTDLAKYGLGAARRTIGEVILCLGKLFRLQNRLVMIGRKPLAS